MAGTRVAKVEWKGAKFRTKLTQVLRDRMRIASSSLKDQIYQDISVPVGTDGQRSEPGEPPRMDTEALRKSLSHKLIQANRTFIESSVGAYTEYAEHLELGTWKMKPRPYLVNALHTAWRGWMREYLTGKVVL